jgi:hypothetical protein
MELSNLWPTLFIYTEGYIRQERLTITISEEQDKTGHT